MISFFLLWLYHCPVKCFRQPCEPGKQCHLNHGHREMRFFKVNKYYCSFMTLHSFVLSWTCKQVLLFISLSSSSSLSFVYNIVTDNDSEVSSVLFWKYSEKVNFCHSGTISSVSWRSHWRGKKISRYMYIKYNSVLKYWFVHHVLALVDT